MKDWKKEFDKEFLEDRKGMTVYALAPDLKFFISSLLDQSYSQGRLDREREIREKVSKEFRYDEYVLFGESAYITKNKFDQVLASLDKTDKEDKLTKED